MLVRYPLGEQRSGRLGATIASHNRYGAYYRAGTIPVNPNTARQIEMRAAVGQLSIAWANTLTPAQRAGWDLYGQNVPWYNKLGQVVALKGLAHYVRSNTARVAANLDRIDDPPTSFTLEWPEDDLQLSGSEATQQFTFGFYSAAEWANTDGGAQFIYVGAPQNPSRTFFKGPYRLLHVVEGSLAAPPTSPIAALDTPDWPITEGQRIWCRTRVSSADGRLSQFAETNFLCDA